MKNQTCPPFNLALAILDKAATHMDWSVADIIRRDRRRQVTRVRFACAWVMRMSGLSWSRIAREIGCEDHTSAMWGVRQAERWRAGDDTYRRFTDDLLAHAASLQPEREAA